MNFHDCVYTVQADFSVPLDNKTIVSVLVLCNRKKEKKVVHSLHARTEVVSAAFIISHILLFSFAI